MVRCKSLLGSLRSKFFKYPKTTTTVVVLHHTLSKQYGAQDEEKMEFLKVDAPIVATPEKQLSEADIAAIRIQAQFRGHLARKAYRALRSLVKLQALVRGVYVRKQAKIALHCMHVMVRLQVRVRARQLLNIAAGDTQTHGSLLHV